MVFFAKLPKHELFFAPHPKREENPGSDKPCGPRKPIW